MIYLLRDTLASLLFQAPLYPHPPSASMLRKTHITNPNPELLNAMELYPNHMIVCSGPEIALDLYEVRL